MNGAAGRKKTEKSKSPHAKPAYGAPKFVLGLVVRATRQTPANQFVGGELVPGWESNPHEEKSQHLSHAKL
jgi:hypothetical protein